MTDEDIEPWVVGDDRYRAIFLVPRDKQGFRKKVPMPVWMRWGR